MIEFATTIKMFCELATTTATTTSKIIIRWSKDYLHFIYIQNFIEWIKKTKTIHPFSFHFVHSFKLNTEIFFLFVCLFDCRSDSLVCYLLETFFNRLKWTQQTECIMMMYSGEIKQARKKKTSNIHACMHARYHHLCNCFILASTFNNFNSID